MKRLLQIGTVMLLMAAFIPLLEIFDRWDAPGLSNDTEYRVFTFVLIVCLVLLVARQISSIALMIGFLVDRIFLEPDKAAPVEGAPASVFAIPPLLLVPLRI